MRRSKTVIASAFALMLTALLDTTPAEAQNPARILRPLTAPLRMILRGIPRARHVPRAYRSSRGDRGVAAERSRDAARRQATRGAGAATAATFWPIGAPDAFEDMLGYAFWPTDYSRQFWSHGPGDILRAMTAPAAAFASQAEDNTQRRRRFAAALVSSANAGEPSRTICIARIKDQAMRPLDRIEQTIRLDANQQQALNELRTTVRAAIDGEAAACRDNLPATQPERLRAMIDGLWAMRYAEFRIRPAIEEFYGRLTDEQKAQLAEQPKPANDSVNDDAGDSNVAPPPTPAAICGDAVASRADPFDPIQRVLRPTDEQRKSLQMLYGASMEMAQFLTSTCPTETPSTPMDRVSAASDRVMSLLHAAMNIEPLFGQFYGSLGDEQRRRLNTTLR
jgi:LTXXQ motif family protein